jgi:signal transduction histidine kinase/putative methionine-R-sulfoxide reductase with GAF domain
VPVFFRIRISFEFCAQDLRENFGVRMLERLSYLIITRKKSMVRKIRKLLANLTVRGEFADDPADGMTKALNGNYDVLVIDTTSAGAEWSDFLKKISECGIVGYVVIISEKMAVEKMMGSVNSGVYKCLAGPVDIRGLQLVLCGLKKSPAGGKQEFMKSKNILHLEVFNEIARKTLSSRDESKLFWELTDVIYEKLGLYNVSIFMIDEKTDDIVLKAFSGGLVGDLVVDYSLRMGEGMPGWVAENRQSLVSGNVKDDPVSYSLADNVLSEMAVPIIYEDVILGVLHAESVEANAFSPEDLMTFETVADHMALAFDNVRLSRELRETKKLSETINDSLPVSVLILDRDFRIEYANYTFCEINDVKREDILDKPFHMHLSDDLMKKFDLYGELDKVLEFGLSISHSSIRHSSPFHIDKILNITISRVRAGKYPRIMILFQDVTEFSQKTYQLNLLREISLAMEGVEKRDKLLYLILTCVTAGFAMGFSRAFLFLVDNKKENLHGIMGVGPSSYEEAVKIWNELSRKYLSLEDYLDKINRGDMEMSAVQHLVEGLSFDLKDDGNVLVETVHSANYIHILDSNEDPRIDDDLRKLLASDEIVTIPLIAGNVVIGVLLADNAYSGRSISLDSIEVLTMFGVSAAMAIEKAKILDVLEGKISELEHAYAELEKTHTRLIRNERLAAIGELSARLAHEIRNPLSTIGGFAKSIPKKYEDRDRTFRNANIIVEEVGRLEQLLTNVLDFSKPTVPEKELTDIHEIIMKTLNIFESVIDSKNITIVQNYTDEKLRAEFDPAKIKQVLINIIQNALNALDEGGSLRISTYTAENDLGIRIEDDGSGISEDDFDKIYEPFYTTRGRGTGLGLSISRMIIRNHDGNISIYSKEGEGTTVNILLPMN